MAIYTNLPIYKTSYSLLLSISKTMPNIPRDCRFTIGQDLRRRIMDIIIHIYKANRDYDKISSIRLMKEYLLESKVLIRIMSDMHYISERKHAEWMEYAVSMSKQMSAWEKYQVKKN